MQLSSRRLNLCCDFFCFKRSLGCNDPTPRRRLKRAKEKAQQRVASAAESDGKTAEGGAWDAAEGGKPKAGVDHLVAGDELETAVVLRADHRVRSFDFAPSMTKGGGGRGGKGRDSTRVLVALHNNSMEVWGLEGAVGDVDGAAAKGKKVSKRKGGVEDGGEEEGAKVEASCSREAILDLQGHRSDVRAVAVSSDGSMVASVSHGLAKAWSSRTRQCVRSVPCGFGLAVVFAPGDRHLLVGTKEGNLQASLGFGRVGGAVIFFQQSSRYQV